MPVGMLVLIHHTGARPTTISMMSSVLTCVGRTDCGGLYVTDDDVRSALSERNPEHKDGIKDKTWHSYKK